MSNQVPSVGQSGQPALAGGVRLCAGDGQRLPMVVAVVAILALAGKLILSWRTYGSNDVHYFENFISYYKMMGGIGLYHRVALFNHPPLMIHVLRLMDWLARTTGVPFPFWLRLPAIFADLGSVILVSRLLAGQADRKQAWAVLALLAASPISVMVSGFHGNTDPAMMFFTLLSVYLIDRHRPIWLAGVAMGLSMSIKVVPVIFLPAIVFYLPDMRLRLKYAVAVGLTFAIGAMPYLAQDPLIIVAKVFGYGSLYGHWGLSRLASSLPQNCHLLSDAFERYGKYLALLLVIAAAWRMNRSANRPALYHQCGLTAFIFMTFSPGFGVQYLAWLVPWAVGAGLAATAIYYAAGGLFAFLVYNYWSGGLPWHYANSDVVGDWSGYIIAFEILCWVSVAVALAIYARRLQGGLPGRQ